MTALLAPLATGRTHSLFAGDMSTSAATLTAAIDGKRILVIGGAGSIGSSTIRALLRFAPAVVDVIDQNENGLAELVRDVRSDALVTAATTLRCLPIDYGSTIARRFLLGERRYDAVLHFAALKHVRSEKAAVSVLQMLDTNILKQRRLADWLTADGAPARYFAVSTDKAADPVNLMGASKRLMEHALFTPGIVSLGASAVTSARFANVAFSAGSLLASWTDRVAKQQPLAVPRDTRRYFVSMEESAEICLLAAFALPAAHLAIPRMSAAADLRELAPIAEAFVVRAGYAPAWYESEADARNAMAKDVAAGRWPILLTARDTDGEKAEEEFVGAGEQPVELGWAALRAIPQRGGDPAVVHSVLDQLDAWVSAPELRVERGDIARLIATAVPEFAHSVSGKSLDDRM